MLSTPRSSWSDLRRASQSQLALYTNNSVLNPRIILPNQQAVPRRSSTTPKPTPKILNLKPEVKY
jgi:hypothetical protein